MISFENIKTGEVVKFTAEQDAESRQAHIAAYLNSSNLSPNALKGQDFGWRLSPEIVAEMERIRTDINILDLLSRRIGISIDDIRDFHILNYIAEQSFASEVIAARAQDDSAKHEAAYQARLAKLREKPVEEVSTPVPASAKIKESEAVKPDTKEERK
jgi:hypothetical protein